MSRKLILTLHTRTVWVDYTNWHGKRAWRECNVLDLSRGTEPHHEGEQWFLHVSMADRGGARRSLALNDIHEIREERPE